LTGGDHQERSWLSRWTVGAKGKDIAGISGQNSEHGSPSPDAATSCEPLEEKANPGWFERLKSGLSKSSSKLNQGLASVISKRKLDDETLESLEDLLIQADLGVDTAARITETLAASRYNKDIDIGDVKNVVAGEIENVLAPVARPLIIDERKNPFVILVVGVNGSGKTTTIAKLAKQQSDLGKKVVLVAGDTFRAAAIDQLKIWAERTNSAIVSGELGADSSGLVFEALTQAKADNTELLLIDTAGRLQNKSDLMAELEKLIRVLKKIDETAPHAVLLVLDATTGQNALKQVEIFGQTAGVTGLVMTKLDGTARGGILVAIAERFKIPIHAIGVGESAEDFREFDAKEFAQAIALN